MSTSQPPRQPAALPILPPVEELLAHAHVVSIPMRVKFRGITIREMLLVEGPAGWGEFAAFPEYDDLEASFWLRNALEMAWQGPPPAQREQVPINGTIPALDAIREEQVIADLITSFGAVTTFKVKVAEAGQTIADDIARVALVHQLAPQALIRVDANMGWSVDTALTAIPAIVEAAGGTDNFEYAEQPCATVPELKAVRTALDPEIHIAADESIRRAADPLDVIRAEAVDRVVVKAPPLGGPRQLLALAQHVPQRVTVSSALDSAVGMNSGIAAAAALPTEIPACGLGTGKFFKRDLAESRQVKDGFLDNQLAVPNPAALQDLSAPDRRKTWWLERLRRCYRYLSEA
ncbi:MAG: o-succinylbenzoate synthase [Lawsonella sp.]